MITDAFAANHSWGPSKECHNGFGFELHDLNLLIHICDGGLDYLDVASGGISRSQEANHVAGELLIISQRVLPPICHRFD